MRVAYSIVGVKLVNPPGPFIWTRKTTSVLNAHRTPQSFLSFEFGDLHCLSSTLSQSAAGSMSHWRHRCSLDVRPLFARELGLLVWAGKNSAL